MIQTKGGPGSGSCWENFSQFFIDVAANVKRPSAPAEFLADQCSVIAETRDVQVGENQTGQIDLFITRQRDDGKYAIILENKVNRAQSRPTQLQTYVSRARREGFKDEEIFVSFLPLTDDLDPDPEDKKTVEGMVTYAKLLSLSTSEDGWNRLFLNGLPI